LKGKWGNPVLVTLVYMVILALVSTIPMVGGFMSLLIAGPFFLGFVTYFLKLRRGKNPNIEEIFGGFKNFGAAFVLHILIGLFVLLWALLLVIPGIIAAIKYSMAYFILSDNPDIGAQEAINRSKAMMEGNKKQFFYLMLGFLGWVLGCVLTLGIGFLWLLPYVNMTLVNFYENLLKMKQEGNLERSMENV
jgi:uncharacterized membrane protein